MDIIIKTNIVIDIHENDIGQLIDEIDTYITLYNQTARGAEWCGPNLLADIYNALVRVNFV